MIANKYGRYSLYAGQVLVSVLVLFSGVLMSGIASSGYGALAPQPEDEAILQLIFFMSIPALLVAAGAFVTIRMKKPLIGFLIPASPVLWLVAKFIFNF